jgi:hypothetical protein
MNQYPSESLEAVLDAFSVERVYDRETLEKYLRAYPEYAPDILRLSREVRRCMPPEETPLTADDRALLFTLLKKHQKVETPVVANPFEGLTINELRIFAKELGIPRQVVIALKECKIMVVTIPMNFLRKAAALLHISVERLTAFLEAPPVERRAASYKADAKPSVKAAASFESVLEDAGLSEVERRELMEDFK